jgi:hypothetical protein
VKKLSQKTFDEKVFDFRLKLAEIIRDSEMPITVAVMVLSETLQVLSYQQNVLQNKLKEKKEQSEVKEDGI